MTITQLVNALLLQRDAVGDVEVVLSETGSHLQRVEAVARMQATPRRDLHQEHPGAYLGSYYATEELPHGGYAGWSAFKEPNQSILMATPSHTVVILQMNGGA